MLLCNFIVLPFLCIFFLFHLAKDAVGVNLWGPHRLASLKGVKIVSAHAGCCAVHTVIITDGGQALTWGKSYVLNKKTLMIIKNFQHISLYKVYCLWKQHSVCLATLDAVHIIRLLILISVFHMMPLYVTE